MNKIISIVLGLFLLVGGLAFATQANATFNPQITICHTISNPDLTLSVNLSAVLAHLAHGDYLGPCNTPSPSPSPTPTPTPSPSPIPCEQTEEGCPTPTPEPSNPPEVTSGSYNESTCNGILTKPAAFRHVDRIDEDSVRVQWANGNDVTNNTILYGYVGGGFDFSIVDIGNVEEWTINDLAPNKSINVKILSWRDNCLVESVIIDP